MVAQCFYLKVWLLDSSSVMANECEIVGRVQDSDDNFVIFIKSTI